MSSGRSTRGTKEKRRCSGFPVFAEKFLFSFCSLMHILTAGAEEGEK
ncbi:hypothetical protein SD77_2351 [Bacillus badius]|uniref:Ribose 5-phosphate isomerase B n=1 Tax=Bacillus badius TaxID=1455 RepID=A0ABR5AYS3_BACBA|nr:hypothetical protein SD77_2351 [Bacillus badius]